MELSRCFFSGTRWERVSKHGLSTFGLLPCSFVLNDIPVLDQHAIFDANDVCRDPVHRCAKAGESTVNYREIAFSYDYSRLIPQCGRNAFDEIKEAVATRFDMGAMLNVIGRPVPFSRCVVALVEQRFESL